MYRSLFLLAACAIAPVLLAGCGGGSTGAATHDPVSSPSPSMENGQGEPHSTGSTHNTDPAQPQVTPNSGAGHVAGNYYGAPLPPAGGAMKPLQVGCDWFRVYDADVSPNQGNTAFPDTAGIYWIAAGPTKPSSDESIEIDGHYPGARYFSFQAYDENSQLTGALADYLIKPTQGSLNPFRGPAIIDPATHPGGAYNARLVYSSAPQQSSQAAANTIYRGPTTGSLLNLNPVTTALIYRLYLPTTGVADATGGVGLPELVLHSASGNTPLAQSPDAANCRQIVSNYLASLGATNTTSFKAPTNPPTFTKFFGVAGGLAGQGTAKNDDTAFLYTRTTLNVSDIVMIRGRAPTHAQQQDGPSIPDVRYWSVCQNNYSSQKVIACVADRDATIDRSGYYNVVVSTTGSRPALATPANGYNWLRWGSNANGAVIYRNLLASAGFSQSVQAVPKRGIPAYTMDDYAPQISYCKPDDFTPGASPAQVVANCQASDTGSGNLLGGLGGALGLDGLTKNPLSKQ